MCQISHSVAGTNFVFRFLRRIFFSKSTQNAFLFCKKSPRHLEICGPIEIMQKIEKKIMTLKIAKKWSQNDFKAKKKKCFFWKKILFADF